MNTLTNNNYNTFTPVQKRIIAAAKKYGAPIQCALNVKGESWKQSSLGQTHSPVKEFVDTRSGSKISRGQATQILCKFAGRDISSEVRR